MPYYPDMAQPESDNLISDLWRETAQSWNAMSFRAKAATLVGIFGLIALEAVHVPGVPEAVPSVLRVVCLILLLAGSIANACALDEFYQRVYLQACTFSFVVSIVALFALSEFKINLGVRSVSVIIFFWLIGFVVAFARLRRA